MSLSSVSCSSFVALSAFVYTPNHADLLISIRKYFASLIHEYDKNPVGGALCGRLCVDLLNEIKTTGLVTFLIVIIYPDYPKQLAFWSPAQITTSSLFHSRQALLITVVLFDALV